MEQMKQALFKETLFHSLKYENLKIKFGEYDSFVCFEGERLRVLYDVIEASGLAEEYREWKQKQ